MRRLLICILSIIIIQSLFSQSSWKWLAPNPPRTIVYSSVGVENNLYFWCQRNSIVKLNISTESFTVLPVYAPNSNFALGDFTEQGISFADTLIGYVTDAAYGEYRTTDGGQNWTQMANPGSNISLVTFGTSQRGWKVGGGGFYITSNAGASWTYISTPLFNSHGIFSKMFALNQNQLWLLKSFHYNGNEGSIWHSSNAGYSWKKINTGLVSDSLHQVSYTDIKISSSGIGFAIGTIYSPSTFIREGFIQKTTDMGVSWETIKYVDERYKNIVTISDSVCLILGNLGYYDNSQVIQRRTTDSGQSWSFSSPLINFLTSSQFYTSIYTPITDVVYMYATSGVYKSKDRGISYVKITSDMDIRVTNIIFDSNPFDFEKQLCIAWNKFYDRTREYIISFDAGYTWNKKSIPQSMGEYIWLVGISQNVIYMISEQLRLYKSTDFGNSWNQLLVPVYNSGLQALNIFNKDVLTLKAYLSLISTTDGGLTWTKTPVIENLWLNTSQILTPGTVVGAGSYSEFAGTKGAFFKTNDFGLSWHIQDVEKEIDQMLMVDDQNGYAINEYNVYKTQNSGDSWFNILTSNNYDKNFTALTFIDSLNGSIAVRYTFIRTTDGGITWKEENPRIPISNIEQLVYNAKGDLFVIGYSSMLMLPSQETFSIRPTQNLNIIPDGFKLYQNYPNPFNPSTKISWQSPVGSHQRLKVYDVLGREVATLVDEYKDAGSYEVEFDGSQLASGVYYFQLKVGDLPDGKAGFVETRKMILIK